MKGGNVLNIKYLIAFLLTFSCNISSVCADTILTSTALTRFDLKELYIWKVSGKDEKYRQAVIRSPDGLLHIVNIGSTIGKHHGKIMSINDDSIALLEIFPNELGQFYEKESILNNISWKGFLSDSDNCARHIDPDFDQPPKCWWVVEMSITEIEHLEHGLVDDRIKHIQDNMEDKLTMEEVVSSIKRTYLKNRIGWIELKNAIKEGDKIWRYESPGWETLSGEYGYVLVRNKEPIMHVRIGNS